MESSNTPSASPTIGTTEIRNMKPEDTAPSPRERHSRHQQMLEEHKEARAERRLRHRKGWHKIKVIPIQLV